MEKICLKCHKKFIPIHRYLKIIQKFCSYKCRKNQLISKCLICQNEFTWDKHGKKIRKYCSIKCMRIGRRNRVFLICKYCNKEFWVRKSSLKYKKVQYCSKKCQFAN